MLGAADGAVRDHEFGGCLLEQRFDDAARRAAGAHEKDPAGEQRTVEVAGQVGDESRAVGVVAEYAVGVEYQGVDGAGALCPGGQAVGEAEGFFLERHRDVGPAPAVGGELGNALRKTLERREDRLVAHVLPTLAGERGMDLRRLGVGDRVPEYGVAVGHGGRILAFPRAEAYLPSPGAARGCWLERDAPIWGDAAVLSPYNGASRGVFQRYPAAPALWHNAPRPFLCMARLLLIVFCDAGVADAAT